VVGEPRWPMALAVVSVTVITLLLPGEFRISSGIRVLPLLEVVLLGVLMIGDPGKIDVRSKRLRRCSIGLVGILVTSALVQTIVLIVQLVENHDFASPGKLLEIGALVWVANNIAFALLFWEMDSGGAAARAHRLRPHPDVAFPQQLNPELAPDNWRPRFIDYLYLGFTNATALSPTDAMPLTPRMKIAMFVQSMVSLALIGLVIARAINLFPG
jgi:hypothetical protein